MTPAETVLWNAVRRKQLDGLKFRRQLALGPYIVDFICSTKRLIIEVDGAVHDNQIDYDAARTEHLEQYGYRVLRFRNDEVLNQLDRVLDRIREATALPPAFPSKPGEGSESMWRGRETANSQSSSDLVPLPQNRGRG